MMSKASTQKRTVVKDRHGEHVHIERLEDVPEALQQDDLQRDLQQLLRRFCREDQEQDAKWATDTVHISTQYATAIFFSKRTDPHDTFSPENTHLQSFAYAVNTTFFFVTCKLICDQRYHPLFGMVYPLTFVLMKYWELVKVAAFTSSVCFCTSYTKLRCTKSTSPTALFKWLWLHLCQGIFTCKFNIA